MIVDSHCHLDYDNLFKQLDDVIDRAKSNKVKYLLRFDAQPHVMD